MEVFLKGNPQHIECSWEEYFDRESVNDSWSVNDMSMICCRAYVHKMDGGLQQL